MSALELISGSRRSTRVVTRCAYSWPARRGQVWIASDGTGGCQPRRSSVISCLSGMAAEWKLTRPGDAPAPDDFQHNLHVVDIARRAVQLLGVCDGDLLLRCWLQADALVDREWRAIMRLTEALTRHDRLTGDECERIFRGTPRGA